MKQEITIAVVDWLRKHQKELVNTKLAREDVASFIFRDLGVKIHVNSLSSLAKAAGIDGWPYKGAVTLEARKQVATKASNGNGQAARSRTHSDRVERLSKLVLGIYQELGGSNSNTIEGLTTLIQKKAAPAEQGSPEIPSDYERYVLSP